MPGRVLQRSRHKGSLQAACQCEDAMMKEPSRRVSVTLTVAAFLLATVVRAEAQTKQRTSTKTLALGVVFQGPGQPLEEHFRPLADYAARKLAPTAETKGTVVVAPHGGANDETA